MQLGTTKLAPPVDGSVVPLANSSSTSFWIKVQNTVAALMLNCWNYTIMDEQNLS